MQTVVDWHPFLTDYSLSSLQSIPSVKKRIDYTLWSTSQMVKQTLLTPKNNLLGCRLENRNETAAFKNGGKSG